MLLNSLQCTGWPFPPRRECLAPNVYSVELEKPLPSSKGWPNTPGSHSVSCLGSLHLGHTCSLPDIQELSQLKAINGGAFSRPNYP